MMTFAERLNRLLARDGLSQTDLAEALGNTPQAVQAWTSGRNTPRRTTALRVANHFHVPVDWLLDGVEGDYPVALDKPFDSNEAVVIGGELPKGAELIPVYKYTLRFTAGTKDQAPEWVEAKGTARSYTSEELRKLGVKPGRARIAEVTGDSMFPTFLDGDEFLFEEYPDSRLGAYPIVDGRIYAISIGNDMKIKRLSKTKNGVIVRSDNPDYPDEAYTGEECGSIRVYGRVVQLIRDV